MNRSTIVLCAAVGLGALFLMGSSSGGSFRMVLIDTARRDLGVRNDGGAGTARIRTMLGNYNVHQIVDWCGAAIGTWIREACAQVGCALPIPGSTLAQDYMRQMKDPSHVAVGWHDAAELRANPSLVQPGMVAVWTRGTQGWQGHVALVTSDAGAGKFDAIAGNGNGGAVVEDSHELSSANLLGMGFFRI